VKRIDRWRPLFRRFLSNEISSWWFFRLSFVLRQLLQSPLGTGRRVLNTNQNPAQSGTPFSDNRLINSWAGMCLLWLVGLLFGCSASGDKALSDPPPPSTFVDAQPKVEPKSRYGNPKSYVVYGKRYYTKASGKGHVERGIASWYGQKFHGRRTSSGERYNMYAMTAAHKALPLPTYARVTDLTNGRSVVVRINDRGPFYGNRIIDLSYAAAHKLGMVAKGTARVEVRTIDPSRPQSDRRSDSLVAGDKPSWAKTWAREAVTVADEKAQPRSLPYLQVGAFGNRENAERMRRRLARHIGERIEIHTASGKKTPWYKVQVGPFDSRKRARDLSRQLASLGLGESYIVVK